MAIYYPRLFCEVGQQLILRKNITFEDASIYKGDKCWVEDIIGYGFNLRHMSGIDFRIMNSSMSDYFETPEASVEIINSKSRPEPGDLYDEARVIPFEPIIRDTELSEIVMFVKKFEIKDVITIEVGTRFFFEEENGFFNLFDVDDQTKVLNLSQREMKEYCQIQHAYAEELV